jgi:DNA-binding CsgD family transcriptional regulator
MTSDFVGRTPELKLLEAVCSRAERESRPVAALVNGPPGAGKTRLVSELRARQQSHLQLTVSGYETSVRAPLAAAGGLLRTLVKVAGAGAQLEGVLFGAGHREDRPLEPVRLFEAAHRALQAVQAPILLLIDDLQWVDELSLSLCSYLVRSAEAEGKGMAAIGAARPGGNGLMAYESITRDLGLDRKITIVLGPLGRDEGIHVVRQWAPETSVERAGQLWELAEGSPFWLGILARSRPGKDLDEYLLARLHLLSRDAGELLGMLAIGARPLLLRELDALFDWEETRIRQAVAELEQAGLLMVDAATIRVAHELIRDSAQARLPTSLRRELHARLGNWLERESGDDVQLLMEALSHLAKGGAERARLVLRILRSARRRLIGLEGLRELAQVADELEPTATEAVDILEQVAVLAADLGDHQFAIDRWTGLASTASDPALRARSYLEASRAALRLIDRRLEAQPLLAQAQEQRSGDPILEVEIEAHRANVLRLLHHRMSDARRAATRAVGIAREQWGDAQPGDLSVRQRDAYITALQAAFDAAVMEDDGDAMVALSERIERLAVGTEQASLGAALNGSLALWFAGRMSESIERARYAWNRAHERLLPMLILAAGPVLANKLVELGRLSDAEEVISECVELERRIGGRSARLAMGKVATRSIHELRHLLWFSRGDWRDAAASLEQEIELQPDPHYRLHLHGIGAVWLGRCAGAQRERDVARHLEAGRRDSSHAGCRRCARELDLRAGEALARIDRLDEARKALQEWDLDGRAAEPGDLLWRRHVGALIELGGDDIGTAVRELEAVVEERRRLGLLAGLVWARLDLAAALFKIDSHRAADLLRQAAADANLTGAATEQGLAELALRRLGVRTWRRGRVPQGHSLLQNLSGREREIATLVAAGHSNPEIASRLFLSRKTIERHVSNVLARTGARNRTELARLVGDARTAVDALN